MAKMRSRWQTYQSFLGREKSIVGFTLALWLLAGGLFLRAFQSTTLNCQRTEPQLINCDWYSSWDSVRETPSQSLQRLLAATVESFEVPGGDNPYVVHQLVLIGRGGKTIEIPAMRSRRTANEHAETINQFIDNETQSELHLTIRPYLNPTNLYLAVLPALLAFGFSFLIFNVARKELRRESERLSRQSSSQDGTK